MKKTTIIIFVLVVLVVIATLVYFWYAKRTVAPEGAASTTPGLGSQLYQQVGAPAASPLQGSNPFDNVKTNPFE